MKTLIVEDDVTSRLILKKFLMPFGRCDIADNGQKAIDLYRGEFESGEPYNLICLDILIPILDGQAVLEKVRHHEEAIGLESEDKVKIIMTSALGNKENVIKAIRAKCDAFLVKPFDKRKLLAQLMELNLIEGAA